MISVCPWMVLLPAQTFARRRAGPDWVMAVNAYTIGDLTVWTRATAKSRKRWRRARVLLLLAGPRIMFQYPIGERTDQWAAYRPSSFHTACPKIYPIEVCIFSLTALKLRTKKRKKRPEIG